MTPPTAADEEGRLTGQVETPADSGAASDQSPDWKASLAPNHAKLIEDSSILAEVATARGYWTARTQRELELLGFGKIQRIVPALVIPIRGVTGEIVNYQIRPDRPRIDRSKNGKPGKPRKYETVEGSQMRLDVPPMARAWLGDPEWPLFITEGPRKADSAVSQGVCCVALLGVWNWRGENSDGGLTALADWESIAFKSKDAPRRAYIVFDSDVMEKKSVYAAMKRLKPFLELRGADVKIIYLPSGAGGVKVGLDDYFAQDHTVDELLQLVTDKLREPADDELQDPSIPRGFSIADDGSIFSEGDLEPLYVCSPLKILAHTRADDATSWGKLLEWTDYDQIRHRWAMPMDELKGDSKEWLGRLLNEGLRVGSSRKAKERLSDFIQASNPPVRARCVNRPGWHGGAYVDVAGAIGASDGEEIILQTGADWPRGFESSGTLEDWKSQIGQHCRKNPLLLFAASVAFAAKLLFPLRLENAGFHLRGTSSKGKTTLIQVAASVEGDGAEKGGFIENWHATANGLEAVCERHNDSILPIDELAQCDPRVAAEAAYLIANGQGKGRMNRTVTARRRASWRTVTLSSGEISLAGHVLQAGKRVRAGQEVRLLDLPIGKRQFGVFDSVNGFSSGQAFADHLKVAAGQFYGVPGREFVRKLIADDPDFSQIRSAFSIFLSDDIAKLAPAGSSSEVTRAAAKFGLMAFAGETATAYGLTGWEEGDAKSAAIELFKEWLSARGSSGGADDEAIVSQVRLFIEQHGESRFCRLVRRPDQADDAANDRANDRIIINRAGYFDGETYFFSREVFKAEVCRGFDHVEAARALERRKCLEVNHGLQFKRRDPESGKVIPFYAVSSAIFE